MPKASEKPTCSKLKHNEELPLRRPAPHANHSLQYQDHQAAAHAAQAQGHHILQSPQRLLRTHTADAVPEASRCIRHPPFSSAAAHLVGKARYQLIAGAERDSTDQPQHHYGCQQVPAVSLKPSAQTHAWM